jgi:hypothetical protein
MVPEVGIEPTRAVSSPDLSRAFGQIRAGICFLPEHILAFRLLD